SCCAPCNAYPLQYLSQYFHITLYFNNNNLYPSTEYQIRLQELQQYVAMLNETLGLALEMVLTPYDYEAFEAKLFDLREAREGGVRCVRCYELRMDEAFAYANAHHFDYFCTVMTISRQKNSQILNELGAKLQPQYPNTQYFYSDFKKQNGNLKGIEIAKACNMYRQTYCGCRFSWEANTQR
ncbi:MAG: epoxyqueuosine reductase QueH, partial [Erysipelotrichaceae bacterium]